MKGNYFDTYISRLLKSIEPEYGITGNAKQQVNSCICILARKFSEIAQYLTLISGKKTMSCLEIGNAVRLVVNSGFSGLISDFAERAVEKFTTVDKIHTSRQNKAGICFPPSVVEKYLRSFGLSKIMIVKAVPIYLASCLEYIVVRLLTIATINTKQYERKRITIRDLEIAMRKDVDLRKLFEVFSISFIGGGVVPHIHGSLIQKKTKRRVEKDAKEVFVMEPRKVRRFRPGTVSIREIKKMQKTSNCLLFSKYPFERLVRRLLNEYKDGVKIGKDVFVVLQYYIEQYITEFLRDVNATAVHCGRVKIIPADIQFIAGLRKIGVLEKTEIINNLNSSEEHKNGNRESEGSGCG